jgi:hypothetical protein
MVTITDGVWCDPCLEPLIRSLNSGGVLTVASCCGHGNNLGSIALSDGRWLAILPDLDTLDRLSKEPTWTLAERGPEHVFPVMTDAQFPHGLRCPTCGRDITEGQPYQEHPTGMSDGDMWLMATCVYCPLPGGDE